MNPVVAYQMTSMLQGVVKRGTGYAVSKLGLPLGGKTGTTNDYIDAWFVGFSPAIAVGTWVGFDSPKSLGHAETGARAALPIWQQFVGAALQDARTQDFPVPEGVEFVQIDAESGLLPGVTTQKTITEAFAPGTAPTEVTQPPSIFDGTGDGEGGSFNPLGIF